MKLLVIIFFFAIHFTNGQDPIRFKDEISAIQKKYDTVWDSSRETIVFTGSSSVRIWNDLQDVFPDYQIVNSGFGGSHASDLLTFINELVLRYEPQKVFIYEGDNDISYKKRPRKILLEIQEIIEKIKAHNSQTNIVLIAAKPSLARWHLRRRYKKLNRKFERLAERSTTLQYANVWDIMLNGKNVRNDIFLADGLHMNAKGYDLWYAVLKEFMK
ncbi:MAG: G-D-S-L family lipolytic protein [Eudoraea sp.]|nr:G-D-S-L family lipolytic protein [Eudoraea sp.]